MNDLHSRMNVEKCTKSVNYSRVKMRAGDDLSELGKWGKVKGAAGEISWPHSEYSFDTFIELRCSFTFAIGTYEICLKIATRGRILFDENFPL